MDTQRQPEHYVIQAVTFGDRPSGAIAITALRKTAELSQKSNARAAEIIMHNSYVDDILHSTATFKIAKDVAHEIDRVLAEGPFVMDVLWSWKSLLKLTILKLYPVNV